MYQILEAVAPTGLFITVFVLCQVAQNEQQLLFVPPTAWPAAIAAST